MTSTYGYLGTCALLLACDFSVIAWSLRVLLSNRTERRTNP